MLAPLLSLWLCAQPAAEAPKPRLAVLDVSAGPGIDAAAARALTEALTVAVSHRGVFQVVSTADITAMLGLERQKQLMGCDGDSCVTELAGALDARLLLRTSLNRAGDQLQLTMQTIDAQTGQTLGRGLRLAKTVEALQRTLPSLTAEATGLPQPPGPSLLLPVTALAAGAAALVAAGVIAFTAFNRDAVDAAELKRGEAGMGTLRPASYYRGEAADIGRDKTIALVLGLAGIAATATGIVLWPRGSDESLALVPTAHGFALVGTFP